MIKKIYNKDIPIEFNQELYDLWYGYEDAYDILSIKINRVSFRIENGKALKNDVTKLAELRELRDNTSEVADALFMESGGLYKAAHEVGKN